MTRKHDCDIDQQKECDEKYPSWKWVVGIVTGAIMVVSGLTYAYARQEAFQDSKISDHEIRIVNVERIHRDLDTVKALLRSRP